MRPLFMAFQQVDGDAPLGVESVTIAWPWGDRHSSSSTNSRTTSLDLRRWAACLAEVVRLLGAKVAPAT